MKISVWVKAGQIEIVVKGNLRNITKHGRRKTINNGYNVSTNFECKKGLKDNKTYIKK